MTEEEFFKELQTRRNIEVPCLRCNGLGEYMYGSTATWRHGIAGQAMTMGVCDQCWGSGNANRKWLNLRELDKKKV